MTANKEMEEDLAMIAALDTEESKQWFADFNRMFDEVIASLPEDLGDWRCP